MVKKLAVFLWLILSLWTVPLNSKVLAASNCGALGIISKIAYNLGTANYPANKEASLPEGIDGIFFTLEGPLTEGATYRLRYDTSTPRAPAPIPVYSTETKASNGQIKLSTNDSRLLSKGVYSGVLEQKNSNGGFDPYCADINYAVGNNYTRTTCGIGLNLEPVINQTVVANVSKSTSGTYKIVYSPADFIDQDRSAQEVTVDQNGNGTFTFTTNGIPNTGVGVSLLAISGNNVENFCSKIFDVKPTTKPITQSICTISPASPPPIDILSNISVTATNLIPGEIYKAKLINKRTGENIDTPQNSAFTAINSGTVQIKLNTPPMLPEGDYTTQVYIVKDNKKACTKDFTVGPPVANSLIVPPEPPAQPPAPPPPCKKFVLVNPGEPNDGKPGDDVTEKVQKGGISKNATYKCVLFDSAIGGIETDPAKFATKIFAIVLSLSGGIALVLIMISGYRLMTSQGNPEKVKAAQETLTSAIVGLLFIIFSLVILQIIGVDLLRIPGLGK